MSTSGFYCAHPKCRQFFPFPDHSYESGIAYSVMDCTEEMKGKMYFCPDREQVETKLQALQREFALILVDAPERRPELEMRFANLSTFVKRSDFANHWQGCYETYQTYLAEQAHQAFLAEQKKKQEQRLGIAAPSS